jgi:hypothetical protein
MTNEEMDRAGREIANLLASMVAQMRSKGHEKATARFVVDNLATGDFVVSLTTGGEEAFRRYGTTMNFAYCRGNTPTEALDDASGSVRGMAESVGKQAAAWFDPSQNPPLVPTAGADSGAGNDGSNGEAGAAVSCGEAP